MCGCMCVWVCLPLFSGVVLSDCPVSWDRRENKRLRWKKHKVTEKCRRQLQGLAAEMPVCVLHIPAGSQMWVLYLWITQWQHDPTPPSQPPRPTHTHIHTHRIANQTVQKKKSSQWNMCHSLPHRITELSRREQTAVARWAGNRPLGCQRTPSHVMQTFFKAFQATLWFAYLELIKEGWCQLKMSALNMQSYTYILEKDS